MCKGWRLAVTYVISEPCIDVKNRSCIEECPVDCIYEVDRMLYIHPEEGVARGARAALHPPWGGGGLRGRGACLPVGGHLLRRRRAGPVEGLHHRQRHLLHRGRGSARLPGRGGERWRCAARRRI